MNMVCIDVLDKLSEFYDKQLSADESALVKIHLKVCSECAEIYDEMVRNIQLYSELPEIEPPADFMDKLHAELVKCKVVRKKRSVMRWVPICAGAAAFALVIAGWGLLGTNPGLNPLIPDIIAVVDVPDVAREEVSSRTEPEILAVVDDKVTESEVTSEPIVVSPDIPEVIPEVPVTEPKEDETVATEELYAQIRSGARAGYISEVDAIAFLDSYEDKIIEINGERVISLTDEEWQAYLSATVETETQVSGKKIEDGYKVIVSQ